MDQPPANPGAPPAVPPADAPDPDVARDLAAARGVEREADALLDAASRALDAAGSPPSDPSGWRAVGSVVVLALARRYGLRLVGVGLGAYPEPEGRCEHFPSGRVRPGEPGAPVAVVRWLVPDDKDGDSPRSLPLDPEAAGSAAALTGAAAREALSASYVMWDDDMETLAALVAVAEAGALPVEWPVLPA